MGDPKKSYTPEFKLKVVLESLQRAASNRVAVVSDAAMAATSVPQ